MTVTQDRRQLAKTIASRILRIYDYTEGTVHATRIALNECQRAHRDLGVLISSLEERLALIDQSDHPGETAQPTARPRGTVTKG